MASVLMTSEKCSRCTRHLAVANTSPDRLCGYCQRAVDVKKWRAEGSPRVDYKEGENRPPPVKRNGKHSPTDVKGLSTAYLLECHKELRRRAAGMAREAALLKPFMEVP